MSALPDRDHLFPFVVPAGHVQQIPPDQPWWPLGHDTAVVLVWSLDGVEGPEDGVARGANTGQLAAHGLTQDRAYDLAVDNLMQLVRAGGIRLRDLPGADGKTAAVVTAGHWLAATVMLIPSLYLRVARALGTTYVLASIPERGVLLTFAEGNAASREAWRSRVRRAIGDAEQPITERLFRLTPDGPEPYEEDERRLYTPVQEISLPAMDWAARPTRDSAETADRIAEMV